MYVAAVVDIISKRNLSIDAYHTNQPNKSLLVLHKQLICFSSCLKQTKISNRAERFSFKGGSGVAMYLVKCVSRQFKTELILATDNGFKLLVI